MTVVVATSDWPQALRAAVDSIVEQDYPAWEVVLVDDRRPVAPPPLVAAGDGRVRVVLGPGRGAVAAWDRGCESAQGHLIAYLADRARMAPGWLAALARAAGESPEADVFVGRTLALPGEAGPDTAADLYGADRPGRTDIPEEPGPDRGTVGHRRDCPTADGIGALLMSGQTGRVRLLDATACVRNGRSGPADARLEGSGPGLAVVVR